MEFTLKWKPAIICLNDLLTISARSWIDSNIPQNNRWHTPSLTKNFFSESKVLFTCRETLHQNLPLNIFHQLYSSFFLFPSEKHRGWGLEVSFGSKLKRVPWGWGWGKIWQVFNKFFAFMITAESTPLLISAVDSFCGTGGRQIWSVSAVKVSLSALGSPAQPSRSRWSQAAARSALSAAGPQPARKKNLCGVSESLTS